jgi:uncharacterized protein
VSTGIRSLIVKIAERCNLNCGYCYMYQHADQTWRERPPLMSRRIFSSLLERILSYCDRSSHGMQLCFHGGEPTLAGSAYVDDLAYEARSILGPRLAGISMQTNATLIDRAWLNVLARHSIRVGVSLDGPPELNDQTRPDHRGAGSTSRTVRGLRLLQDAGLLQGILCVINPGADGLETYRYFRSLGVTHIDYLLPDVSHDEKERRFGCFGETPVSDYLLPIFRTWFAEDDPTVRIRLFWNLITRVLGGPSRDDAFGNDAMSYLVIETDGSIQALDALRVCKEGIADSRLNVVTHGFEDLRSGLPLVHRLVSEGPVLPNRCRGCGEQRVCGGGYLPHRYSAAAEFDNPSVWCRDILKILAEVRSCVRGSVAV